MIKAIMTNFGKTLYMGDRMVEAMQSVERAGFEAAVTRSGQVVATFSPISGWRFA